MSTYYDCRNPVLPPDIHIPDVEAHVMPDGRVYVYGSWDQFDDTYCSRQYRVFSSANMLDWTDHGVSFDADSAPWMNGPDAPRYPHGEGLVPTPRMLRIRAEREALGRAEAQARGRSAESRPALPMLYAPDCVHRDGKYYLYFCGSDQSEGVAVSDRPEGPFDSAVRIRVGGIDPAVLVDASGGTTQAYYAWGGGFLGRGARLDDSMAALVPGSEVPVLADDGTLGFYEGSSLRKTGDTYTLVYCCVNHGKPTSLAYATSKAPLGPYTYGGIIVDNDGCDPFTWNNHGSIECVNGQWYVFYHRASRNSFRRRRLCIEPIAVLADGSIPEVPMTSQGAGRPFGLGETIEAWRACGVRGGAYVAPDSLGREALTGLANGAAAVYRYVQWDWPASSVVIEAAGSGEIAFCLDGEQEPTGRATLRDGRVTESWFAGPAGSHELALRFGTVDSLVLYGVTIS
ncbi:MAG: family 43 glycosylhydrolase [Anaerolineae bacterium]